VPETGLHYQTGTGRHHRGRAEAQIMPHKVCKVRDEPCLPEALLTGCYGVLAVLNGNRR
jgi:hypothetical protein